MTTLGLIGAGAIGSQVARLAVASGHDVVVSNSRGPETLAALVAELGPRARAATALEAAKADDQSLAEIYGKVGVKVSDMSADDIAKWKAVAQDTAWKDSANRNAACANLLKLAEAVVA